MNLRDLLNDKYSAWWTDVPPTWRTPLLGVQPNLAGVPASTEIAADIPIFPRLKTDPIQGAPVGASVLRCLDRVAFSDVRVVVMGQDPYPRRRQATGRGFEQGSWVGWDPTSAQDAVPASFRRVIQRLVQTRTSNNAYAVEKAGWTKLVADLALGTISLAPPGSLYDSWEDQGAIILNKVLSYTLPAHVKTHHGVYWLPVVRKVVEELAKRPGGYVVFAMWGAEPAKLSSVIKNAAVSAGAWNSRVSVIKGKHPARDPFLAGPNPFERINDTIQSLGGTPLDW